MHRVSLGIADGVSYSQAVTGTLQAVLGAVLAAIAVGTVVWIFTPLRHRLETKRMVVTGDHGLRLLTYARPEEMSGLDPNQMLGMEPFWLTDSDFYFPSGVPSDGPSGKSAWQDWARKRGGEGAGWRHILIRLQATQDRTVLVLPPRLNVAHAPVTGGVILGPEKEPGGNGLMCRQFEVILDSRSSTIRYFGDDDETPQFKMSKGDSEAFLIIARAEEGRFEWTLDVPCLVDGQEVVLRADDSGAPFVTVGLDGIERLWWIFDEARWTPAEW